MMSECEVIPDMYDILCVFLLEKLEDLNLNGGLLVEFLLILDNLESHIDLAFVVESFHDSTE